jgi:hypothetical protein
MEVVPKVSRLLRVFQDVVSPNQTIWAMEHVILTSLTILRLVVTIWATVVMIHVTKTRLMAVTLVRELIMAPLASFALIQELAQLLTPPSASWKIESGSETVDAMEVASTTLPSVDGTVETVAKIAVIKTLLSTLVERTNRLSASWWKWMSLH